MNNIIKLRHKLHQNPELSNKEYKTSKMILDFMKETNYNELIEFDNTGLAFVFDSKKEGKSIIFRTELDALPITEKNDSIDYSSNFIGVSHTCGHDGHMAIILVLAKKISLDKPITGKVILLFQPAEEIGEGALKITESEKFKSLNADYIFALHNIPGEEKGKILIKEDTFAAASKGMTISLTGKTSHAAEPENGINPASTISKIVNEINKLNSDKNIFSDLTFATIIHIKLGEIAFGTSPGEAKMMLTLRAFQNKDMDLLTEKIELLVIKFSDEEKLKFNIKCSEVFPATINDDECNTFIKEAVRKNKLEIKKLEYPFRWSEDFGYYTEKIKGGFFGLGSGINQPALHNPDYDFPDDIIEYGANMFYEIYKSIQNR